MNGPIYKIGEPVVCVEGYDENRQFILNPIIVDDIYTVLDAKYCRFCGQQFVDVGSRMSGRHLVRTRCNCNNNVVVDYGKAVYYGSDRFVPLQEWQQDNEAVSELLNDKSIYIVK